MQIYLVGGAVRDHLLGIDVNDRDWVVTGSTPEIMLAQGFITVGKDFPVFLHPKTREEYALARTEKKSGVGYKGFDCFFSPDVTLEDDLLRRDLTINAIAKNGEGKLIDPYHGIEDIQSRTLRHVSEAFTEDPVRVLRVARFAAKYAHMEFTIAPETQQLMKSMVESGELNHLTPERVWQEFNKALSTQNPQVFLRTLRECGALAVILPEVDRLFGVPQPEKWHPEIDTGIHTLMVTQRAAELSTELPVRFAAIMHDLGKGVTPKDEWPSHKKHHMTGLDCIKSLCQRIRVPAEYRDLALLVCRHHTNIHKTSELRPATIVKLFNQIDVWRKPHRLEEVLLCCQADAQGRKGYQNHPYPQKQWLRKAFQAALKIDIQEIINCGFQGQKIREELNRRRTKAIAEIKPDI